MARVHLFEFSDQPWFPGALRDYETDFLQFLTNFSNLFRPIAPLLADALRSSGQNRIIDLASGGGGGMLKLNQELQKTIPNLKITLTDFYPNVAAFRRTKALAPNIDFVGTPVDARNVPADLTGLRTQFLSFHHFAPDDARRILQNAVDSKSPIAIFEGQERTVASIVAMIVSPVSVLLTTPFIRPFRFGRIFFTYLIPILPLAVVWDGIVSCLRTYSVNEMQELVNSLADGESFNWQIGRQKYKVAGLPYLIGIPKNTNHE